MAVDFSIKNVPDDVAESLRERAKRNHRSLQGELRAILEAAVQGEQTSRASERSPAYSTGLDLASGRRVAPRSEAALMIREDRDGRMLTVADLFAYVSSLGPGTPDESTAWIRKLRASR